MSTDGDQTIPVEKGGQTQPLGPLIIKRRTVASQGTSLVIQMLTICRKRMQKIPWQRLWLKTSAMVAWKEVHIPVTTPHPILRGPPPMDILLMEEGTASLMVGCPILATVGHRQICYSNRQDPSHSLGMETHSIHILRPTRSPIHTLRRCMMIPQATLGTLLTMESAVPTTTEQPQRVGSVAQQTVHPYLT